MKKALTYIFLAISSLIVVSAFVTAKSYVQLIAASLLYPGLIYLIIKTFRRQVALVPTSTSTVTTQAMGTYVSPTKTVDSTGNVSVSVSDSNKRDFLKMIGAAGLSFFLFQVFNKRTSFFGSSPGLPLGSTALEDASGKKIDPAKSQPTDGYRISEIDDGIVSYYGFINNSGGWFIMQEDSDNGSFRYIKGNTDFPSSWANRANLNYDYFYNVF